MPQTAGIRQMEKALPFHRGFGILPPEDLWCNVGNNPVHDPLLQRGGMDLPAAFRCIRAAAAAMEGRGGCIISTGSVVGLYGGRHQAAYAAAKQVVASFTEGW